LNNFWSETGFWLSDLKNIRALSSLWANLAKWSSSINLFLVLAFQLGVQAAGVLGSVLARDGVSNVRVILSQ
jgi:hypothetical protein